MRARTAEIEQDDDLELVRRVVSGEPEAFEPLIRKYQSRVFATARRHARRENEVEDLVQEVFIKAFRKLRSFQAKAPFEHWLMRIAVRTCYDHLRAHQRRKESNFSEISGQEVDWLDHYVADPTPSRNDSEAARALIHRLLEPLSPSARLVITLLEIEEKSVKEIAALTGWSPSLVKVKAFRARKEMRKYLERLDRARFL